MREHLIKQTKLHDPENGVVGNCMDTCYANYLGVDISQCPAFEELFSCSKPNGFWWDVVLLWWSQLGYEHFQSTMHSDVPKECDYYFVTGISPRNASVHHLVIYKDGALFFDPHPDNTGIVTNTECSFEWVVLKPTNA